MQDHELKKNAVPFWKWGVFLFISLIFVDQIIKHFAFNVFRNYAFAFSLPVPEYLIYLTYLVVLSAMVYYVFKNYKNFSFTIKLAWTLVFAGAVSNIGERIILGYVRDFIYISLYQWTGIYNLADGFIILGIIILLFKGGSNSKLQISNTKL